MDMWEEICQLASTIVFSNEDDALVWQFTSDGVYSVQWAYSFYLCDLELKIAPRVQHFLWLLRKNKLLTRDNLNKRRKVEDLSYLFCNELESIHHF